MDLADQIVGRNGDDGKSAKSTRYFVDDASSSQSPAMAKGVRSFMATA